MDQSFRTPDGLEKPDEDGQTVSLDQLFNDLPEEDVVVDDPLIEGLPYGGISWPRFEALCAHLLNDEPGVKIRQAMRYGREGQSQYGLDIIAYCERGSRHLVAQCKRVRTVSSKEISQWTNKFLDGPKVASTSKYILCLATRLGEDTRTIDAWMVAQDRFDKAGIEARVWDSDILDQLLRERPGIVTRFFGVDRAKRFCDPTFPSKRYPSQFREGFLHVFENQFVAEQLTTRLDVNLPSERFPHLGGMFVFARGDLSGITFAVDGKTLLSWARWRARADLTTSERPYARRTEVPGRFVLASESVRFTLTSEEVGHLDWVIHKAWECFLPAADALEREWRFLRFERLSSEANAFVMGTVSRPHWRTMLAFANAHDFELGNSEKHIFDRSNGMLKVYSKSDCYGMKKGYHLILRGFSEGGMTLPWEEEVLLVWEAPTSPTGTPAPLGPACAWDVEHAHDWILNIFAGWVEKWTVTQTRRPRNGWWSPFKGFAHTVYSLQVSSSATFKRRDLRSARTARELIDLCTFFQGHFHIDRSGVPVDVEMTKDVLRLTSRFLQLGDKGDLHYIAGKLTLDEDSLETGISQLCADETKRFDLAAWLDTAFRCLIQLLRNAKTLSQSDIEFALDLLGPVASRVREDLLCNAFSTGRLRRLSISDGGD